AVASAKTFVEIIAESIRGAGRSSTAASREEALEEIAEAAGRTTARVAARKRPSRSRIAPIDLLLRGPALPIGAKLVVLLALLGIAEYLVGLVRLFETALGFLVIRIDVRMVLAGALAIRGFDLRLGGAAFDPE